MIKKLFDKKTRIYLFPLIFNSAKGEPFKKESYFLDKQQNQIEFFFMSKSKYNNYLLEISQYVVWTINQNICRVFIDKNYYKEFRSFYKKKINVIYVKFLYDILKTRKKMVNKKNFYCFIIFFFSLFMYYIIFVLFFKKTFLILFLFFLLIFFLLFNFINIKQNLFFNNYKKKKFEEVIEETKKNLGEIRFQDILKRQQLYNKNINLK
jgi:hypothetical protein